MRRRSAFLPGNTKNLVSISVLVSIVCAVTLALLWSGFVSVASSDHRKSLDGANMMLHTLANSYAAYAVALADPEAAGAHQALDGARDRRDLNVFRKAMHTRSHAHVRLWRISDGRWLAGDRPAPGQTLYRAPVLRGGNEFLGVTVARPEIDAVIQADYNRNDALKGWRRNYLPRFYHLGIVTLVILLLGFLARGISRRRDTAIRRWQALFNHSIDANFTIAVRPGPALDWPVVESNEAARALVARWTDGASPQPGIGGYFPDWTRTAMLAEHEACMRDGAPRAYMLVSPDRAIAYSVMAVPVCDGAKSAATHLILQVRDVSERERNDVKLENAIVQAEEASRAKSAIIANTSHELRTPLNAIIGYCEMMQTGIGGALNAKQAEYVDIVRRSGRHLLEIISDILDLAKIESGRFELNEEEIDLRVLIDGCVQLVQTRADEKNITLAVEPFNLPPLWADPLRLRQILVNLLSNAVKFTDIGQVGIGAARTEQGGIALTVSDTGSGMTPQEVLLAMEPFRQAESGRAHHQEGTGLGLPLAKKLTLLHGGTFTVNSQKGYGTEIILTFDVDRVREEARLKAAG